VYLNTNQVEQLSNGDKAERSKCLDNIVCLDLVSICDTVKDVEEEEGNPFRPTGSETMEEPNNVKPRERRVSDVIDSTGTRGPDSPVSLGYDSVDSGTPKSSTSPDPDAYPSSPKKLLKMAQVDVTDASSMSQDNVMSSR
jgi:hypothetical protein